MFWYLSMSALAASPEIGVHAAAAVGDGDAEEASWAGASAAVEWPIRRFDLGGRILFGGLTPRRFADAAVGVTVQPTARVWLTSPERAGLSAVVGAGLRVEGTARPVLSGGLGLDLGGRGTIRPRVEGSYHWTPERWRWGLSAGVVFGRTPAPEPVVEPVAPVRVIERGLAWIPAPVCDWLEPDELALRSDVTPLALLDERGLRPFDAELDEQARQAPRLVVAAWPGDEVVLDGEAAETDADGLVVAYPAEGLVTVQVRGAGRQIVRELAVADEHALWFAVQPPPPIRVRFGVARTQILPEELQRIREVVENRGGWTFEVRGSHSPEGDPDRNTQLARARADAVVAALKAEGLSEEHIQLSDIIDIVGLDAPPEELRAAVIYPREAQ